MKTLTLAPYCKFVLYFLPIERLRTDALRNGKASLSFSLPFCVDDSLMGFSLVAYDSLATQKIRDQKGEQLETLS